MGENGKKYLMYGGGLAVLIGLGVVAYKLNKRKSATMFMAPTVAEGAPPAVIDPATGAPELPGPQFAKPLPPVMPWAKSPTGLATTAPTVIARRGRGAF